MSLSPDLRLSLLELIHSLEELLTRPLREQQFKPDLGRFAAVAQLTLWQARHALAADDETQAAFDQSPPMWCPPGVLGQRIRARHVARHERDPFVPKRPRA